MSPLDDQLRAALHGRADVLTPAADPLAGIERRARGLQRRRLAAAVTGAALAVAAIAIAVPSLTSSQPANRPAQVAGPSPWTLDAAKPWPYRGDRAALGELTDFKAAWSARHPGSTLTPLFGRIYESSRKAEVAFVASGGSAGSRYGFAQATNAGPMIRYDSPLAGGTGALPFALYGDEGVLQKIVVAAPGVTSFEYAGDGTTYAPMAVIADGVAITGMAGLTAVDQLRVTAPDGTVVFQGNAPDGPSDNATPAGTPANVLVSWPERGATLDAATKKQITTTFATALNRPAAQANYRPLYTGTTADGIRYSYGQAWFTDESAAYDVGYSTRPNAGFYLGPPTPKTPEVRAFLLGAEKGATTNLLVVIPSPRTTQVLYADNATGPFRPVNGRAVDDGVVVINRAFSGAGAGVDRLQLLTGNGDPATDKIFQGNVVLLLCGVKECG